MAENVVLQSLIPLLKGDTSYYWSLDNKVEIELILQWKTEAIPIQV